MKLIVGLGNPGREYEKSRHNVGFCLIDLLSERWSISVNQLKHRGLTGSVVRGGEKVMLLKPQTFMNLSGASVAEVAAYYKILRGDILVVVDDMALEIGYLRLRAQGSAGGHNGLADIIARLGGDDFGRLRIGIGSPPLGGATAYVLGRIDQPQQTAVAEALQFGAEAVECWLERGIDEAMTRFNRRNAPEERQDEQNQPDREATD